MKIFLIGKSGQVGSEIFTYFTQNNIEVVSFSSKELDISNLNSLQNKKEQINECDAVINTAAYTLVDKAEEEQEKAFLMNGEGAKNCALICKELNKPLIHLSTDYVFSGKNSLHIESEDLSPLSVYGKSKAQGEQDISKLISNFILLRVSWVFGKSGLNFVKTMVRLALEREEIKVVEDQIGGPTPAANIAEVLYAVCQQLSTNSHRGIYHYCGKESVSWYEFAVQIIEILKKYRSKVIRPPFSTLSCEKIKLDFGIEQKSWHPYLEDVIQTLIKG